VLVNEDLFKIDPAKIRDAHIAMTMVGGKVVYQSGTTQ